MPAKKKSAKKTAPKKEKSFEETLCDTANTALRENAVIKTEGTLQSEPSFH